MLPRRLNRNKPRARDLVELGPQPVDHLVAGRHGRARASGFRVTKTIAGVAAACRRRQSRRPSHRRIGLDDVHELQEFLLHRLEGDALVAADAALMRPFVLVGEEALGHNAEEIDIQAHRDQQDRP